MGKATEACLDDSWEFDDFHKLSENKKNSKSDKNEPTRGN